MIASWMLYTLFVSLAAAIAVAALDAAGRSLRLPTRHVWAGGMAACVALGAAGLWRAAGSRLPLPAAPGTSVALPRDAAAPAAESLAATLLAAAREGITRAAASVAAVGDGAGFWALAGGWMAFTALLLAIGLLTHGRFRRGRRGWPLFPIAGIPVRVAPGAGPAVIGLLHPEIVVPAWLLEEPAEHQRMVVLHEDEHIRGRDPLLAGIGFALAALMPWNPVMWWLLRGMRWAAEVDCDRRVLRHDVPRRAYGSLLIELAGRAPRLSLGGSHFSGSSAALRRRLTAMTARMPRWPRTRAVALGALSALALVGACEARMPTSAEIEALDARQAEAHARDLHLLPGGQQVTYTVDGRPATAAEAHAIAPGSIVQVNVTKGDDAVGQVAIITTAGASADGRRPAADPDGEAVRVGIRRTLAGADVAPGAGAMPVILIDGVRSTPAALHALRPEDILQVNVLKGAAAGELVDGAQANQGVIRVITKAGHR